MFQDRRAYLMKEARHQAGYYRNYFLASTPPNHHALIANLVASPRKNHVPLDSRFLPHPTSSQLAIASCLLVAEIVFHSKVR
ncbi:Uncharacterised protein [Vibrio cholerae]|nr:Uncharacterised protein [Vibrio cholerae]